MSTTPSVAPSATQTKPAQPQPMLTVEEALTSITTSVRPMSGFEKVAIHNALSRILAENILSPINVPTHTNSAMDGYAVIGSDIPTTGEIQLKVLGTAFAGQPFKSAVHSGECARIMTGGMMPEGTDTVIMQEDVNRIDDLAHIGPGHKTGQNVRLAGEDLMTGQTVLQAGRVIQPADLGLLASLGVAEIQVRRRLRVAFFSTGDELRSIGEPLGEGEIYDSNRYTLYGMLSRLNVDFMDMGVIRDRREDVRQAFLDAADNADVVITSGGVSVGEADFVKQTLDELGQVNFWKIAMKPGRPLAFGNVKQAYFFGLPGNPVSVMVTFQQFVQPALQQMMGVPHHDKLRLSLPAATPIKKVAGRTEFQRGIIHRDDSGQLVVSSTGQQGSGILSSMSRANCYIILDDESANVSPGALVEVEPFSEFI